MRVVKLRLTLHEAGKEPRTILSDVASGDSLIIGRGQNVQLWVNDKNISREHCKIFCENDAIFMEDLASRNGTFINGHRVVSKYPLKGGEQVRLASTSSITVNIQQDNAVSQPIIPSNPPIPGAAAANTPVGMQPQTQPIPVSRPPKGMPGIPGGDYSLVGQTLKDTYRVEERIGAGGMAVVYKATHLALNRPVAIKTLAQRLIQNPKAIKRFLNVAKVAGQLTHPNIVQIHDSGSLDDFGIYYIVMEYVEGDSLNSLLKDKKQMSLDRACTIISYIASALTYANKRNIIHRDINPSNILVGKEDVPKLIGLGLAKCLDDEITALTQPGQGMGMVGYIAPEQLLDASQSDHRSDIYSLAAVFYRCICGQTPYDTRNMREYFNCIHNRIPPIPPHELNQQVPRSVSDLILKGLAHDPNKRYQTAEQFVMVLKNYIAPRRFDESNEDNIRKKLMAMLPSGTSFPGFEFGSIYSPFEGVGGDFYDFVELNNNEIGIIIGDVTGHGLEAAVVVGMVKSAVKILGKHYPSTADALSHANEEIYPDLDATTFATVFYGVIDRDKHCLRFCRAGHNPLIVYNPAKEKKVITYDPKGMVLGMFSKCECEEMTIPLHPGDCLIQYTDGITEAMNADQEEFGMERLCQTILQTSGQNIGEILVAIEDAVKKFTGAEEQQDDIAIIGIRVL